MSRSTWTTYRTAAYMHSVAQDQASAGGVVHYQVRQHRGQWQRRAVQANGRHRAAGEVQPITDAEGEAYYATAKEPAHA